MIHSLCEHCAWMRGIVTPKGSRFLLCRLSSSNADYPKYPPQPIVRCQGYQPIPERESWRNLLSAWALDPTRADQKFEEVCKCYAGPERFYHTLHHVTDVVRTVESLGSHTKHLHAVKLAGWLHDVIYDSKASDNEERSAEYAEHLCEELSIPEGPLVAALIRKTKTHDALDDADAQVLLDADLAILGADDSVYQTYTRQIRQEYAWVPEAEYKQGRKRVLESFLTRPRIYHLLCQREEPARRNLAGEIARLAMMCQLEG